MELRTKTLLVIGLSLACLIGALYLATQTILLDGFVQLELTNAREQVQRVHNTLMDEIDNLSAATQDYAFWNDTYNFIQNPNESYIQEQLFPLVMERYQFDVVLFVNLESQIVFGRTSGPRGQSQASIPSGMEAYLAPGSLLVSHPNPESRISGLLLLPENPLLVASMPILTSDMQGPVRGALIWGRYLDAAEVARLANMVRLPLTVYRADTSLLPADFQIAQTALIDAQTVFAQPLGDSVVAGYTRLDDLYGAPALILRADLPRNIYMQGQTAISYFMLFLLIAGLGFGTATIIAIERLVSSREEALRQVEQNYRELFESIDDAIIVHDLEGNILAVNEAACRRLGYTRTQLLRMKTTDIDAPGYAESFKERLAKQLTDRTYRNIRGAHITRDGRTIPVYVNTTVTTYQGQEAVLGVVRDITELKIAEDRLLHANAELERYNSALRALHQTGIDISAPLDMSVLRRRIIERAVTLLDTDGGNLYLYDEVTDRLVVVEGVGTGDQLIGRSLELGEGLAGKVFLTRQPFTVEDYSSWLGRSPVYDDMVFSAVLSVPLCWRDQTIGVLNLHVDRERHIFDAYDVWLAEMFAAQAVAAIQNARLFEEERHQRRIADALRDAALVLASTLTLDEALKRLIDTAQGLFPRVRAVTVQQLDKANQTLRTIAASRGAIFNPQKIAFHLGEGIVGHAIAERRVINVSDITTDPRFLPGAPASNFRSLLVAPLIAGERVWGTFSITAEEVGRFSAEDENLAELLARHAAVTIENIHLYDSERHQREIADTLRDIGLVLTGALNQEDVLKRILEQVARVLPYDAAGVWLIGEDGLYRQVVGVGYEQFGVAERIRQLGWTPDTAITLRHMSETHQPMTIPDVRQYDDWLVLEGFEWLRSWAGAPIMAGGKMIGQFSLDHTQPGFYGSEHEPILEALATQISIAVENARLFEQVQNYADNLEALVQARTAEIARQQARTDNILRSIGDAVIIFEDVGSEIKTIYANDAFYHLTGWTADAVINRPASGLLHELTTTETIHSQGVALHEDRAWRGTLFLRRPDGTPIEVEVTSVAYHDEAGNFIGFISSIRDIGPERTLERMKAQFMTLVSHQLRTPLTSLKLRLHLLRKTGSDPEQAQKHLDLLEQQTDRLIRLMEKVLSATRLTEIRALDVTARVNSATLLENIRVRFTDAAVEAGISLQVMAAPDSLAVLRGSEEWLTQACYELVENALSYTPAGGHVSVSLTEQTVDNQRYAVFSVQDSGPGIGAEDMAKLNVPFTRLDAQWSGATAGMGLGLFIARTVAEQHGGCLAVESEPGVGSVFSLWLPR